MRSRLIESRAGLEALREEWAALHAACGLGLFQSHAWTAAQWDVAASQPAVRPAVLRLESDGRLCLVPLQVRRRGLVRRLEWLGMQGTDYCDVLATPGWTDPALAAALEAALPGCDLVELRQLRPGSRAAALLGSGRRLVVQDEACPVLQLPASRASRALAAARRRLEREGTLRHRWAETEEDVAGLAAFVARHKRLGLGRVGAQTAGFAANERFLKALAPLPLPHASSGLWLDDRLIAAQIGFVQGDTLLYYLPAYDAGFRQASPGRVLLSMLAAAAAARGLARLDLLRGLEPYKAEWTDEVVTLEALRWAVTARGAAFLALRGLVRQVRRRAVDGRFVQQAAEGQA